MRKNDKMPKAIIFEKNQCGNGVGEINKLLGKISPLYGLQSDELIYGHCGSYIHYSYAFKNICLTLTNSDQEEKLALLKLESSANEVMINICDQVTESNFSVDIFGLQA